MKCVRKQLTVKAGACTSQYLMWPYCMIFIALYIHKHVPPMLCPSMSFHHVSCGKASPQHQLKASEESCLLFPLP